HARLGRRPSQDSVQRGDARGNLRGRPVGVDMWTLNPFRNNPRLARRRRIARGRRDAAALVEMAIAMPLLCMLTLGLIEYGWVFLRVSQINQAARHGVRVAVRPDAT